MLSIFLLKFDKGPRKVLLWIVPNLYGTHLEYSHRCRIKTIYRLREKTARRSTWRETVRNLSHPKNEATPTNLPALLGETPVFEKTPEVPFPKLEQWTQVTEEEATSCL